MATKAECPVCGGFTSQYHRIGFCPGNCQRAVTIEERREYDVECACGWRDVAYDRDEADKLASEHRCYG